MASLAHRSVRARLKIQYNDLDNNNNTILINQHFKIYNVLLYTILHFSHIAIFGGV